MKMKKILASVAAAALAVSAMATTAFAADPVTVDFGDGYTGAWSQAGIIPKTEFDKFDGDVKVVLNLYATNVADGESYLLKPMEADKGWDPVTSQLTTAKETAKPDGFIMIHYDQTEVEFVVPSAMAKDMWDGGLSFQVNNVVIKSATLSDGEAEGAFNIVEDADTAAYCAKSVKDDAASEDTETASSLTANLETALYVGESVTWVTAKSDSVTITGEGDYTYSISDLDIAPEALTVIYIKDVAVENGNAATSDIAPIKITYKSLKINGEEVAVKEGAPDGLNEKGVFDVAFYNIWDENYIDAPTANINSVELTINVAAAAEEVEATEATEKATEEATEAPESTTEAAPAETTAAPAETTAAPSAEETTQAAPAETTAAPAQAAGDTNTATADKNNADTGIEGVAAVAGLAVLAAGAVVIAKKRK